ncbi:hypothetical protein [Nucisporomicrobium flavum]|uniref:hypothetical protein n=1 Tax=Nucisporomicrobium flavum TaxID=2785915 RepID=UPI0018F6F551|nr:hypothetical protein [Nucisporomicrobium flavum]
MDTITKRALGTAGIAGDLARVAAVAALLWAIMAQSPANIARFAVVALLLLIPRITGLARPFDAAFGWTLILATAASAAGWYQTIAWIDWVIHCVTTGAVAAMAVLVLARYDLVPSLHGPGPRRNHAALILLTTATGLSIGVVWEFYEWLASEIFGITMVVGYTDTIADLAMDGLGSIIAGLALTAWAARGFTRHRASLGG